MARYDSTHIALNILFAIHYSLSIIIICFLYIHDLIYLFGWTISCPLLVFFIGYCNVVYLMLTEAPAMHIHPFASCLATIHFLSAEKYHLQIKTFVELNRRFVCCKITNYAIIFLTMPLFVFFAPFISISNILVGQETDFWIKYQVLSISSSTFMQFVIFCFASNPFIVALSILLIINIIVGITYLIITLFLAFDSVTSMNDKYLHFTPFMIVIESLLILNIISIASYVGIFDFHETADILLWIPLINVLVLNLPFYKSYALYKYMNMYKNNPRFEYILNGQNTNERLNRVFFLSEVLQKNFKTKPLRKQMIRHHRIFIESSGRMKKQMVEKELNFDVSIWRTIGIHLYKLLCFLGYFTPVAWIFWISLAMRIDNLAQFVFLWMLNIAYLIWFVVLIVEIKKNSITISVECMLYAKELPKYFTRSGPIQQAKIFEDHAVIIATVFQCFQADIAMLVMLYLRCGFKTRLMIT